MVERRKRVCEPGGRVLDLAVRDPDTECFVWTAARSSGGYGVLWSPFERKTVLAHRAAYEAYVGPIPEGLTIDHLCRNRACVNPAHLEVVTIGMNVLRGESVSGINSRRTHCKSGHIFDKENTRITPLGTRLCRECHRIDERRRRRMRRAA